MGPRYLDPTLIPRVTVPPWTSCNRLYVEFLAKGWSGITWNKRHLTLFLIWIVILNKIIEKVIHYSFFFLEFFFTRFNCLQTICLIFFVWIWNARIHIRKITINITLYKWWCKIKAAGYIHVYIFLMIYSLYHFHIIFHSVTKTVINNTYTYLF